MSSNTTNNTNQNKTSKKQHFAKHKKQRSRGGSYNDANSNLAVKYAGYNNSNNALVNNDEQLNKKKTAKIVRISDNEPFILQTVIEQNKIPLIELIKKSMKWNFTEWRNAVFKEQIEKDNLAACELKRIHYQVKNPMPEDVNLTGVAEGRKASLLHMYNYKLQQHFQELAQLQTDRAKLITRLSSRVSKKIWDQVEPMFPDYLHNPNVIAVIDRIQYVYDLAHFDGRKEDLEQQVSQVLTDFYVGTIALNNLAEYGTFDMSYHKQIFEQILNYRRAAKLPEMDDIDQGKTFLYSCESIKYLRDTIQEVKHNENQWNNMLKNTEQEIAEANRFRIMPRTLQAAYDKLIVISDIGRVYKEDLIALQKNLSFSSQRPNIQNESKRNNNKKNKNNDVTSTNSDNASNKKGKHCLICGRDNHYTSDCNRLPAAILALQAQDDSKALENKKTSVAGNSGNGKNEVKTSNKKPAGNKNKKNVQKPSFTVDDDSDSDIDDNIVYQFSNRIYDPKVVDLDTNNPYLTQYDNGCSHRVQEFRRIDGICGTRRYEGDSYRILTSNGIKDIKQAVVMDVKGFGKCLWNKNATLNLISQHWVEKHYRVDVIRVDNITLSYHVHLTNYDTILKFDLQPCGIYVGSIEPLLYKPWRNVPRRYIPISIGNDKVHEETQNSITQYQYSTFEKDDTIDPDEYRSPIQEVKDPAIKEKLVNAVSDSKVLKVSEKQLYNYALKVLQPNIGFVAPRAFEVMMNKGMIINTNVPSNVIRKATEFLGPSTITLKAKSKAQKRKPNLSHYIQALKPNERLIQIDLMFVEELVFLFSVAYPGFHCVLSYLGFGEGCRKATNMLPHIMYALSVQKAMHKTIKYVSADGEKGFAALATQIQENGGVWLPLGRGEHPVYLDIMTQKVKMIARAFMLDAGYKAPRKLMVGVMHTAVHFVNYLPNNGNPDQTSPMMFNLGVPLDWKNYANIRTLQMFEVKVEKETDSNTMKSRTITAIASHPSAQGWKFLNLMTFKLITSTSYIPRPPNKLIFDELSERRKLEELALQRKPKDTVIAAVQSKNFDWRKNNFQCQKNKYGVLNTILALKKEIGDLIEKKETFHPVFLKDIPKENCKRISSTQALFNTKPKNGETILKGRLVVNGNTQDRSQFDKINDIQSPTVELSSIFQLIITAAMSGYALVIIDFPQSFLMADQDTIQYAKLRKEVARFVCVFWPEYKEYMNPDGTIIVQLDKALYGQIQAPRLFNKFLVQNLSDLGFRQNVIDLGLFYKEISNDHKAELATHVDDVLAIVPVHYVIQYIEDMKDKFGSDLTIQTNMDEDLVNPVSDKEVEYLGMLLSIDYDEVIAKVNPRKYYTKLLKKYSDIVLDKVKRAPSKSDFLDIDLDSPKLEGEIKERFTKMIYQLRYPCFMAPETLFHAAWLVSRIHQGLTEQDRDKSIHFIRYINGRKDLAMQLGPNLDGKIDLSVFSDASQGITSYTSTVISTGRGVITTICHKQKQVQLASAHTELVAAAESTTHALHIQHVMESRGLPEESYRPCKFYEDNMAVIHLMKNGRSINSKSKHIHIRYFFMKQYFDNGDFEMIHCATDKMVADINTKPKVGEAFLYLRDLILGYAYIYE